MDRKTQRELARLSQEARRLWEEQRDVLAHAKDVARHASQSASDIAKRDLIPRAHETYRDTIEPTLQRIPWRKVTPPKKASNPFVYVLMAIGALALALVGYAAWQTVRADDDLWVEDGE
jgi:ABC-type transporter Mla subunit MlaD